MILGYLRQWWHGLTTWHMQSTTIDPDGRVVRLDCAVCNRVFYSRGPAGKEA